MGKEGKSNVEVVRQEFGQGHGRFSIPLEPKVRSSSISYLRRLGELPRPTPEETRRTMSEAVSRARGGVLLAIEPYAKMGMTALEIQEAMLLSDEPVLGYKIISRSLSKARKRGHIDKRTEEEKRHILRNTRLTKAEIRRRVLFWLEAAKLASKFSLEIKGRLNWMKWANRCIREGLIVIDGVYHGEDNKGLYRLSGNKRWRQFVESDDGGNLMFDSIEMALKRKAQREKH